MGARRGARPARTATPAGPISRVLLESGGLPSPPPLAAGGGASLPAPALERAKLEALLAGAVAPASTLGSSDDDGDDALARFGGAFGGGAAAADGDSDDGGVTVVTVEDDALAAAAAISADPLAAMSAALDKLVVARPGVGAVAASPWGGEAFEEGRPDADTDALAALLAGGGAAPKAAAPVDRAATPAGSATPFPAARRGVVAHAFEAALPEELTVAPGDRVRAETEVDGWLEVVRVRDGAKGLVPASYVAFRGEGEASSGDEARSAAATPRPLARGGSASNPFGAAADGSGPPVTPRSARSRRPSSDAFTPWPGVVSFAFDAEAGDELSVRAGDAVTVVGEVDGWFHVADARGGRGLVPASYVERRG